MSETAAGGGATGTAPVARVNILAALEALDGAPERRQRAIRRGGRLLDLLDEIRIGLLAGSLAPDVIARLAATVGETRAAVDDPDLLAVLDAIELRAQVELAKYEQAIGSV